MSLHYVFLDPSTRSLGYAVFQVYPGKPKRARLRKSGTLYYRKAKGDDWHPALDTMVSELERTLEPWFDGPMRCWIEQPDHIRDEGHANQSYLKVVAMAYTLRYWWSLFFDSPVVMLPVRNWKGSVPKHVTMERVRKHWGWNGSDGDHDESDAVGMGDYVLRKVQQCVRWTR